MSYNERFKQYDDSTLGVEEILPIISLQGFSNPVDYAEFTLGIEAIFISPDSVIVTTESQQQDEEIIKNYFSSVFMYEPQKTNIFALGEQAVAATKNPEKTIFIIKEKDIEEMKDEAVEAKNIITLLKDQKVGIFSNLAEAKQHIQQQLGGDMIAKPVPDVVDVDALKDAIN